jgi:hypothetical protein
MGESAVTPTPRDSQSLPQPDVAELRPSAGAKAVDYAVGDVIDDRFEIRVVLGQGGFRRSTGCATMSKMKSECART